jgi:hypothetical protein
MKTLVIGQDIQINDQILASKGESLLIANVTEIREKCVKIDYCWESVWSGSTIVVYTYTTFVPKSQIIKNEVGWTLKKWFLNNMNPEFIKTIKKYFVKDNVKNYL